MRGGSKEIICLNKLKEERGKRKEERGKRQI